MVVEIQNREDVQLSLFEEPVKASAAVEGQTLASIVYDFLQKRLFAAPACRSCGCPGDFCRLSDGDKCSLNASTGYCSAPQCLVRDQKTLARISPRIQGGRYARRVA